MALLWFRPCPAPACMALACMQYRTSFVLSDQRHPPTRADNELDQARRHGLGGVDRVKAVAVRTRGCPSHVILNLHDRQGRLQQVSSNASYLPVSLTSSSDSSSTHTLSFCIEIPLMAPRSAWTDPSSPSCLSSFALPLLSSPVGNSLLGSPRALPVAASFFLWRDQGENSDGEHTTI